MSAIYSQGFNFTSFIQKGVDPRTGQYTCAIAVYDTPAESRNCPSLHLSLTYNPINAQDIGLGKGWSFNLSSYQHRRAKTLLLSTGENYQVTETTSSVAVKDQKLKSFQFKKNGNHYEVVHKSSQVEILSNASNSYDTTVPIELHSPAGRQLKLVWAHSGEQPRLQKIQDGSDTLLNIDYSDALVKITRAPGTAEASTLALARKGGRLIELRLPLDGSPSWKFDYGQDTNLTKIKSPAGLEEDIAYNKKGHQLPRGAPQEHIPYVSLHTQLPGNNQPAIKTKYSFSNQNFLGFGSGFDWKDGEDNLYRAREDYRYSSTVQVDGGATTKYTYNRSHLLVSSETSKGGVKTAQTTTYYMLSGRFSEQPAQYQLPKSVQTTYQDTAAQSQRVETTQYAFDDWGNSTQVIQPTGVKIDREYYPPAGETDHCPSDPHGFQRYIKCSAVTPASSTYNTPINRLQVVYSQLPTAAAAPYADYFVAAKEEKTFQDGQEVSSVQHSYVNQPASLDHGRLTQDITRVSGQYPTTTSWTYQRSTSGRLTQATKIQSFDGSSINETASFSLLLSGLALMHQDSAGVQTDFEYDLTGQLVKKTFSPGTQYEATECLDYTTLSDKSGYCITLSDTKGVQTRYYTDGLQRVCRVEEQDDQGQVFRLVQEHSYDSHGQCITVVDTDWIRTTTSNDPVPQQKTRSIDYDDWGHVCRVTESNSVVTSTSMDPVTLTCREDTNGGNKRLIQLNEFGAPTKISLLNRDGTAYATAESMYDGLGRLVQQKDAMGRVTQYQLDAFDRITQTTWPGGRVINTTFAPQSAAVLPISIETNNHVLAGQSFDGLGRFTSRQIGGRTTRQTYDGGAPKPSTITTPKGDTYHLTYEPNLNYALLTSLGVNNQSSYQYDAKSLAPLQLDDLYCMNHLEYLPSGLISKESVCIKNGPEYSAVSAYSMAGRLLSYTDANGQRQEMQYDNQGRPQKLVQGALNVTYAYDDTSRLSVSSVQKEHEGGTCLTTHLTYDDFSREIGRMVYKGNETLYELIQTYYETGHVNTRRLEDARGSLLRQESFQYDEHDRLVDYQCQGPQSPSNEKGLQLQRQSFVFGSYDNLTQVTSVFQDGSQNVAKYLYNAQDVTQATRITNTHPSYDTQVDLEYDQNGCLTRDDQLNRLEYDAMNRLTAVKDQNGNIRSQYHYDASGKLVGQVIPGKAEYHLHYRENMLVGFTSGDKQVSYVSDGAGYWGQISKQGNSTDTDIWASDGHESVMAWLGNDGSEHYQQYTPYGFSKLGDGQSGPSIGFNGQWCDPVTGWYHLGNGYRVYNPVLMVFHSPDSWSPFTSGEINPYAYCLGDPINRIDPSGHFSLFGIQFTWRDLAIAVVGTTVGIIFGVMTGGAGFAIEVGLGIVVGATSDVITGMFYDSVTGKGITLTNIGTDLAYGLIGGIAGEGIGRAIGAAGKAAIRGLRGAHEALSEFVRNAEKLRIAGGKSKAKMNIAPRPRIHVPEIDALHGRIQRAALADKPELPRLREELETLRNTHFDRPGAVRTYTWTEPRPKDFPKRMTEEAMDKYNHFRDLVRREGNHPTVAAREIGDADYESYGRGQFRVKLGGELRLSFRFADNVIDTIKVGHV